MDLKIFDVEHGACALLTCDNNTRIMIDCGHNASNGWYPGTYLRQQGVAQIEMLAVTNYDEDHVNGIADLFTRVNVLSLMRNKTVSALTLHHLKSEDGMGSGIKFLAEKINLYTGPPIENNVSFQGLTYQCFSNPYPMFDDENNLSLVIYLRCNGVGVLFPGDLEADGWHSLLMQPEFRKVLGQTHVLIASHHGRENGWYDELRQLCSPYYVVISDKGYQYDTQRTIPLYRSIAKGGTFRADGERRVLTTRNDGRIGFNFGATGNWGPY